jgi:hypothetical protein
MRDVYIGLCLVVVALAAWIVFLVWCSKGAWDE